MTIETSPRDLAGAVYGRAAAMSMPLQPRPPVPPVFHCRYLINGLEYDAAIVRHTFGAGFSLHIHVRVPGLAWEVMPGMYQGRSIALLGPAISESMRAIAAYAGYGV